MAAAPIAPPGLEPLIQVNEMHIKQTRQSSFQSCCTYELLGPGGRLMYRAAEQRQCWGPRLDLRVSNTQGHNVFNLLVPSNFCSWESRLQVSSVTGELLGYIDQHWGTSNFDVLDPSGLICLKIKGPGWGEAFMSDTDYEVLSADKTSQIGVITRVWKGMLSINDHYIARFPIDLHVAMKATLVACPLFIDLLREQNRRNDSS